MNSIEVKRRNIKNVISLNNTSIEITRKIYTVVSGEKVETTVNLQPQNVRITKAKFSKNPTGSQISSQPQAEWLLFAAYDANILQDKNTIDRFTYNNMLMEVISVVNNTENGEITSIHAALKVVK